MSEATAKPMGFVGRCKEFFGLKQGQALTQFAAELKALSQDEKMELHRQFNAMGLPTELPAEKS